MNERSYLTPAEIAEYTIDTGIKKTKQTALNLFILGVLAGAFIAFAAEGSNMAAYNLFAKPETYGLGKALAGAIFGTGLMLVLVAGGELFTGNTMIIAAILEKKVTAGAMLKNWFLVYFGNFLGAVLIAYMMNKSGLYSSSAGLLGGMTIKIASYKVGLTFMQAFYLGIMCNWLVCLAVWMCYGAKDVAGKLLAVLFPIWLFITSGFEHSVANMYYIPAGIMAKCTKSFADSAMTLGVTAEKLANLNWGSFIVNNLVPVTLGNIVGGGIFVAAVYWFVYIRKKETVNINHNEVNKKVI